MNRRWIVGMLIVLVGLVSAVGCSRKPAPAQNLSAETIDKAKRFDALLARMRADLDTSAMAEADARFAAELSLADAVDIAALIEQLHRSAVAGEPIERERATRLIDRFSHLPYFSDLANDSQKGSARLATRTQLLSFEALDPECGSPCSQQALLPAASELAINGLGEAYQHLGTLYAVVSLVSECTSPSTTTEECTAEIGATLARFALLIVGSTQAPLIVTVVTIVGFVDLVSSIIEDASEWIATCVEYQATMCDAMDAGPDAILEDAPLPDAGGTDAAISDGAPSDTSDDAASDATPVDAPEQLGWVVPLETSMLVTGPGGTGPGQVDIAAHPDFSPYPSDPIGPIDTFGVFSFETLDGVTDFAYYARAWSQTPGFEPAGYLHLKTTTTAGRSSAAWRSNSPVRAAFIHLFANGTNIFNVDAGVPIATMLVTHRSVSGEENVDSYALLVGDHVRSYARSSEFDYVTLRPPFARAAYSGPCSGLAPTLTECYLDVVRVPITGTHANDPIVAIRIAAERVYENINGAHVYGSLRVHAISLVP